MFDINILDAKGLAALVLMVVGAYWAFQALGWIASQLIRYIEEVIKRYLGIED